MSDVPVLLVGFNRPEKIRRVAEAIKLAGVSRVFLALDGPRAGRDSDRVAIESSLCQVRETLGSGVDLAIDLSPMNIGCPSRVTSAISWVLESSDRLIVLEDDCVPHRDFFRFVTEMLERYQSDAMVGAVCGTSFHPEALNGGASYYFSRYNYCWGWATWKERWSHYDQEMEFLGDAALKDRLSQWLTSSGLRYWENKFNLVKGGQINSWAYRWTLSFWSQNYLAVQPCRNLVSNIGFSSEGTNCTWKGDPLGNRPTHAMDWPLKHPGSVIEDRQIDSWCQNNIFQSPIHHKAMRFMIRLLSKYGPLK